MQMNMNLKKSIFQGSKWPVMLVLTLFVAIEMYVPAAMSAQSEPAGFVLMSSGDFHAVQLNQVTRKLNRKSPFYPGEILRTGADAKAQVRFVDGSLIALRADTEIKIDEFRFNEPAKGEDKNIFTLINGGFRTITGKIGKKNPDNYQMKSSVASIGVRGTTYEVVLGKELNVAAWQGTIIVENDAGKLALGVGAAYNFATVGGNDQMPRGLLQPPSSIKADTESMVKESGQTSDENEAAMTDEKLTTLSTSEYTVASPQESLLPPTFPDPLPPQPSAPADSRLTGITLDRVGMSVRGGSGFTQMLAGGLASDGSGGSPVITDNSLDPSQAGFGTTPATVVLKQDTAALQAGSLQSFAIDTGNTVTWGVWQGTTGAPVRLETSVTDSSVFTAIDSPVFWATATPTTNTSLASRTGMVNYRNVAGYLGGSNSGNINNLYLDLDINFDTAAAVGKLHIYTPAEFWNINLSGTIAAPTLNFTSVSGSVTGAAAVQGTFDSLFTGATGQAILSAFDFEAVGNPALHVEGLVLVNDTPVGDVRLTSAEWASLDHVGVAFISNTIAGVDLFTGRASDGSAGSPIITDNGFLLGDAQFLTAIPLDVMQQGGAVLRAGSLFTDSTYSVSWGIWDGATGTEVTNKLSPFDPLDKEYFAKPTVWLTLVPTPDANITAMTGKGQYKVIGSSQTGFDYNNGALWTVQMGINVDFDTALFKGTGFIEDAAFMDWNIEFDGSLAGARFNVVNLSGTYNYAQALAGDLELYLVGNNAEALAGAFDLEWVSDPTKYVVGAFEGFKDLRLTNAEQSSLTRVGLSTIRNNAAGAQLYLGMASSGAAGSPILTQNGFLMSDARFYSTPPNWVIRKDMAPNAAWFSTYTDPTYGVSWGAWDAAGGTPSTTQTDLNNPATITNVTTPIMWLTVLPTNATTLGAKTGVTRYTTTYSSFARTGLNYFASTSHYLSVNFDSGTFKGYADVNDVEMATSGTWKVSYNGWLYGPNLDASTVTGTYTGYWGTDLAVTGDVSAVFTGATAEAVAGAFEFELVSNPNGSVQGVFISQQDLRIAPTVAANMNRISLGTTDLTFGVPYTWVGQSTDLTVANPVIGAVTAGHLPGEAGFLEASYANVMNKGATTDLVATQTNTAYAGYPISWGAWNSGWTNQNDSLNAATQTTVTTPLYWMMLTPTDPTVIAAKTGSFNYATPIAILGGGTGGAINTGSFSFGATVDFTTGLLTGGTMSFSDVSANNWAANFTGSIAGSSVKITAPAVTFNGFGATGSMQAVFTGANAEAIGGSFGYYYSTGSQEVNGVFLVTQ